MALDSNSSNVGSGSVATTVQPANDFGITGGFRPEDKKFVEEKLKLINDYMTDDLMQQVETLEKLTLITAEDGELAKQNKPSQNFLQKSAMLERLNILVEARAIDGAVFIEAVEYLKTTNQILPDLSSLVTMTLEMEKLLSEGVITPGEMNEIVKEYAAGNVARADDLIVRYKNYISSLIEKTTTIGLFSDEEKNYFLQNIKHPYLTILGTPREAGAIEEMVWAIVAPLWRRLETWQQLNELYDSKLLSEAQLKEAALNLRSDKPLPEKEAASIQAIARFNYGRLKGVIKNQVEYKKMLQLLPLVTGHQYQIMELTRMENNYQEAVTEELEEFRPDEAPGDPISGQKRMLGILIEAWEGMLEAELKGIFVGLVESGDVERMKAAHRYLVDLNKKFMADGRPLDNKKTEYINEIKKYAQGL